MLKMVFLWLVKIMGLSPSLDLAVECFLPQEKEPLELEKHYPIDGITAILGQILLPQDMEQKPLDHLLMPKVISISSREFLNHQEPTLFLLELLLMLKEMEQ